jgi:Uma2 family endonuclease
MMIKKVGTMSTTTVMTADELFSLPDDGQRHELVDGEHKIMAPAGSEHGSISAGLIERLSAHVRKRRLGRVFTSETGFLISRDPDTVRAPDAAFVRADRIPSGGLPKGFWPGAPDLAVEVISPSDTLEEVEEKVQQWLAAGSALVWVVNPKRRTVTVYASPRQATILAVDDELDGGEVVSGFRVRVGKIFD